MSADLADRRQPGLVTFGETMALLTARGVGPLRHATELALGVAGAESNVAIGLCRLGHASAWCGRVGDDEFGRKVLATLRGEGVDVSGATVDPEAPTGLMIKSRRTTSATHVVYYRRGSAASRLAPEHLDTGRITRAGVLHVTGITPALSDQARAAVHVAVETARQAGVTVAFDPNHRSALWRDPGAAAATYRDLAARADVLLAGEDEAHLLVGAGAPPEVLARLAALGPRAVILKRGAHGALAAVDGQRMEVTAPTVQVADPVGAGDAFAAGYLSGVLDGCSPAERLDRATQSAALVVQADGDWEGLPRRDELAADRTPDVTR